MIRVLKFYRFILILLFNLSIGFAQNQTTIDSLLQILDSNISDKEKVDAYVLMSETYSNSDSSKTTYYAQKAIALANEIKYANGKIDGLYRIAWNTMQSGQYVEATKLFNQIIDESEKNKYAHGKYRALNGLGVTSEYQGNYEKSLKYYFENLEYSKELNNESKIADTYNNISLIFQSQGKYQEAIEYQFEALKSYQKIKEQRGIASSYNNIGIFHYYQNNFEKSLEYYLKSLEINEKANDKRHMAYDFNNIGFMYNQSGKYQKALDYYFKSLELNKELGGNRLLAYNFNNIGETYMNQGKYDQALEFLSKAEQIRKEIGDENRAYTLIKMATVYIKQEKLLKAKAQLVTALQITQRNKFGTTAKEATEKLALVERELGNFKGAYEAQVQLQQISDSLQNRTTTSKLARLEAEHEFQKEKDSIQIAGQAERALLEKEIEKRKITQRAMFIGLGMLVVLALVLFMFFRSKNRANQEIQKQKQEIALQNEQLLELNEQKDKMFSVVAHDLKSPIDSLQSLLMLFKDDNAMSEIQLRQHIGRLSQNIEGVSGLLNNLLQWSKTRMQGKLSLSPIPLMLEPYVQEAVQIHLELARTKNINTLLKIPKDLPQLWVDPEVLRFLLRNLLSNAYKYSGQHSEVLIEANTFLKKQVIINVIDTGKGLDEQTKNSLFTHMVKSEKGTQFENGTGLGLLLCKEFVELSNGKIGVESELGQGSKFWFTLPISANNTLSSKKKKQTANS